MKKFFVVFCLLSNTIFLFGQNLALKNNLLYDFTLTPNLGLEIALSKRTTLEISGGYNPFDLSGYKRFKHWAVQPEYRYWFCEKFNGSFVGFHLHGGEFSIAALKLPFGLMPQLKDHKYEGYFYGGGVSFGHQWVIGKKWNLEAVIGVGYARIESDKYACAVCGDKLKSSSSNYFGPTKAAVSIIYMIN